MNRLDLGVRIQPICSQLSSNSTQLETSERSLNVQERVTVDPNGSRFESMRDSHGLFGVRGKDGRGESISRVVCELEGLVLRLEFSDRDDRSKDLGVGEPSSVPNHTELLSSMFTPDSPPP